jgi:hypothetical protein
MGLGLLFALLISILDEYSEAEKDRMAGPDGCIDYGALAQASCPKADASLVSNKNNHNFKWRRKNDKQNKFKYRRGGIFCLNYSGFRYRSARAG